MKKTIDVTESFYFPIFADKWPAPVVAGADKGLRQFSSRVLPSTRRMVNHGCLDEGPLERIRIGQPASYPVQSLIDWINRAIMSSQKS